MLKKEIREKYRRQRKALSEAERSKLDDLLLIQFQTADVSYVHHLLSFWPIEENNEPDTHLFNEYLRFKNPGLKVCYPRTDHHNKEMEAVEINADTAFEKDSRNILQPIDGIVKSPEIIDLVFVPLIMFDEIGYRIGYGEGFYDRYLAKCRPDCIKVGFCYFEPIEAISDTHEFDVPLDLCITPNSVYVF